MLISDIKKCSESCVTISKNHQMIMYNLQLSSEGFMEGYTPVDFYGTLL